ncbi:MAG: hypothetical protein Q9197_005508 [Variospora fuerteventurae]
MREIALGVVGTSGSGKSTFIQHALDLKKLPNSRTSTKRVSLEGIISVLRIHEIDAVEVEVAPDGALSWPLVDASGNTYEIDGAVVVYSITDVGSTKPLPELLRGPLPGGLSSRPRALSDINHLNSPLAFKAQNFRVQPYCMGPDSLWSPADADRNTSSNFMVDLETDREMSPGRLLHWGQAPGSGPGTNESMQIPVGEILDIESSFQGPVSSTSTCPVKLGLPMGLAVPDASDGDDNNCQRTASKQSLYTDADVGPESGAQQQQTLGDQVDGVNFKGLVDRLLSRPTSRADVSFVSIFLCFYRQFAAPSDLLAAIMSRFECVDPKTSQHTSRLTTQLRYLSVLATWVYGYPGDFAHPFTRLKMSNLVSALTSQRPFSMAVKEINSRLAVVSENDDTYWAHSDTSQSLSSFPEGSSTTPPISGVSPTPSAQTPTEGETVDDWADDKEVRATKRGSAAPSTMSTSTRSNASAQHSLKPFEGAQAQLWPFRASPRATLSKIHWHLFMELSDEDLARELTRIDWALFSSLRPRDLIRHVSLCEEDKSKCKDLENVRKMIDQFNHIAFWIANIILLRDKPKHRAKALEKCMAIAWKLRQLNNYNSLGAVVAGINGTAVHRLSQTRELVPHNVQKQFMRLEILMGTQKSHFPYRLAWSNTSTERIPFLPLHCRDLASAEEGNPTFLGGDINRINWKKFEILGEIILNIQQSQSIPYSSIICNESVERLLQDVKITKDEDSQNEQCYCNIYHLKVLQDAHINSSTPCTSRMHSSKYFEWSPLHKYGNEIKMSLLFLPQYLPGYQSNPTCRPATIAIAVHVRGSQSFKSASNNLHSDRKHPQRRRKLKYNLGVISDLSKAVKFLPNCQILPQELSSPFLEYLSPRSTLAPPYPSPLAARLLGVDGITSVFYGPDFITITKAADANWAHVKPEVFSLITEAVNSGEHVVSVTHDKSSPVSQRENAPDSLAYDERDSEVVGMIKELLETRIRPAIQDDGGDVDFCGFENGKIEEVKGITQVMDETEITSNEEFTRFEEKLRERRGATVNATETEGKPAEA